MDTKLNKVLNILLQDHPCGLELSQFIKKDFTSYKNLLKIIRERINYNNTNNYHQKNNIFAVQLTNQIII